MPEPETETARARATHIQVAINFDTTGSMAPCTADLKRNVGTFLSEISAHFSPLVLETRLSASGDYEDADYEGGYVFKNQDSWTSAADSCRFLTSIAPTCGYDIPEAYEVAFDAIASYEWNPAAAKALIFIGDAMPHGPKYLLNARGLDWKQSVATLVRKGVTIYGVQCLKSNGDKSGATDFWKELVEISGGRYLCLDQLQNAKEFIYTIIAHVSQCPLKSGEASTQHVLRNAAAQLARSSGSPSHASDARDEVGGRFQIFRIFEDCTIREFVISMDIQYLPGKGFYEVDARETIGKTKEVLIFSDQISNASRVIRNEEARRILSLPPPDSADATLACRDIPEEYKRNVYVQSTSYSRNLHKDSNFLYETLDS